MSVNFIIIEDEEILADGLKIYLESRNRSIRVFCPPMDQVDICIHNVPIRFALVDIILPENYSGLYFIKLIKSIQPDCHIMAMSGNHSFKTLALKKGAHEFYPKPFNPAVVLTASQLNL